MSLTKQIQLAIEHIFYMGGFIITKELPPYTIMADCPTKIVRTT